MELYELEQGLKSVASGGHVLNCQELTGIQAGLTMLKSTEKYQNIFFWGKIFGVSADYYVAYGMKDPEFEFPAKSFYYAGEDFLFRQLPKITNDIADRILALGIDKPFVGSADKSIEQVGEGEEPPADEEPSGKPAKLTEVERLAQVVQEIDFDTAVVPKSAHALNEAHVVVQSSDFKGLGTTEASSLSKYVHLRPPASTAALRALARTDAEFYANFLDPLEGDLPKGCWAVRQDLSANLVTLRSLAWPGYLAYHIPGTTKYGSMYFGYAQKSRDLAFLL